MPGIVKCKNLKQKQTAKNQPLGIGRARHSQQLLKVKGCKENISQGQAEFILEFAREDLVVVFTVSALFFPLSIGKGLEGTF